jgi:hypothetical protein
LTETPEQEEKIKAVLQSIYKSRITEEQVNREIEKDLGTIRDP